MQALVYTADRKTESRDVPAPEPGPDEVLLKVIVTGICGSDLHGWMGIQAKRRPPLVLGHETHCEVIRAPAGAARLKPGMRVAVNPLFPCRRCANCLAGRSNACTDWRLLGFDGLPGAMADQVLAPAANVHPLADGVDERSAVIIEPLACAVHLMSLAPPLETGSIAIFGAGTLGAMILRVAVILGYGPIWVVDRNKKRLAACEKLGLPGVRIVPVEVAEGVDPAQEILKDIPEGVEVSVDAVGLSVVRAGCIQCVRKSGRVLILGLHDAEIGADALDIVRREVCLQASYGYTDRDFARAQQLVESGRVDIRPWTEEMPLSEGQAGFEKLASDPGDTLKILLRPQA